MHKQKSLHYEIKISTQTKQNPSNKKKCKRKQKIKNNLIYHSSDLVSGIVCIWRGCTRMIKDMLHGNLR